MYPLMLHGQTVEIIEGHLPSILNQVIVYNHAGKLLIKSCIGFPGDSICITSNNTLIINTIKIPLYNQGQIDIWTSWIQSFDDFKIPAYFYFALGTKPESIDSRCKGLVHRDQILGTVSKLYGRITEENTNC
jgi:signal peptidase I